MKWYITVMTADGREVLFNGVSRDDDEIAQVAAEARRRRPDAQIWIKPPMGRPTYQ